MLIWLPILILSAQPGAPMEHRYAETIFEMDFEGGVDLNYDGWPDEWTRLRGQGFPPYIQMGLVEDSSDASQPTRCLRIELDGSGGTAYSPPIEISPFFSYVFQGKLKTEGLTHDVAYFSVTLFDSDRNQKQTFTSEKLTRAADWQQIRLGPLTAAQSETRFAVIGLHLVPTDRSDLTGAAMFDDLCLARLPHMTIESSQPFNLFAHPEDAEFACTVSGIERPNSIMLFELLDVTGRIIASEQLPLKSPDQVPAEAAEPGDSASVAAPKGSAPRPRTDSVTWRPPIPARGFYRVRASLRGDGEETLQHCVSLAVVPDLDTCRKGAFGWSLPQANQPLSEEKLLALLKLANVSWIKYPIWYNPETESAKGERIASFADQLRAQDIEMVGVFDKPPEIVRQKFSNKERVTVADVFLAPDVWVPLIDPLMVRLSLKIQWWQLGADDDAGFMDYAGLEKRVGDVRAHMRQFGQRMRLGLPWNWLHKPPASRDPSWDFLALTETPPFTSQELARHTGQPHVRSARHWITLWPLAHDQYDVETRTRDLVLRMLSAKINGIQATFVANPFDAARGLLHEDGTPSELFLPWCVTSRAVGGAEYLGSMQLPNGSPNYVFARDAEAVMVVWNDTPLMETLYLGEDVVQTDPWGQRTPLSKVDSSSGAEHAVAVGSMPVFLTGLDLAVTRWRLSFSFEPAEIASLFARPQPLQFRFRNTFGLGVGGTARVHVPHVWDISHSTLRFKLGTDETLEQDFQVVLHSNASSGPQRVRIDFDIAADKQYRFSVYRDVQVGHGDLIVQLNTYLDDTGRLIVEQHLINQTRQKLNFNCYLFAPDRRRMRMQVFDIGPGRVIHVFTLPDGGELLGRTLWLRVEEIGGNRVMNYHVIAQR